MLDAMKNPQYMPAAAAAASTSAVSSQLDAELLRQQEAFINQNRMHIEKRRHDRSPERDHRERSYSPPPSHGASRRRAYSRERDTAAPLGGARKPSGAVAGGGGRGGRDHQQQRAGREAYGSAAKRRRSSSVDRDGRQVFHKDAKVIFFCREFLMKLVQCISIVQEPEDEETRAYRLEIEKQKFQREKIMKDKEIRRRKVAESLKVNEVSAMGNLYCLSISLRKYHPCCFFVYPKTGRQAKRPTCAWRSLVQHSARSPPNRSAANPNCGD